MDAALVIRFALGEDGLVDHLTCAELVTFDKFLRLNSNVPVVPSQWILREPAEKP